MCKLCQAEDEQEMCSSCQFVLEATGSVKQPEDAWRIAFKVEVAKDSSLKTDEMTEGLGCLPNVFLPLIHCKDFGGIPFEDYQSSCPFRSPAGMMHQAAIFEGKMTDGIKHLDVVTDGKMPIFIELAGTFVKAETIRTVRDLPNRFLLFRVRLLKYQVMPVRIPAAAAAKSS